MGWARSDQTTQEVPGASDDASDSPPPPAIKSIRFSPHSFFPHRGGGGGEKVEIRKSAGAHYHPFPPTPKSQQNVQTDFDGKEANTKSFLLHREEGVKWWEPPILRIHLLFLRRGKS